MMLDHQQLDNNFDDLIIVYFFDKNSLLVELLFELAFHHQLQLIDQDDLLSKKKILFNQNKTKKRDDYTHFCRDFSNVLKTLCRRFVYAGAPPPLLPHQVFIASEC
jgi:hypothetical protein